MDSDGLELLSSNVGLMVTYKCSVACPLYRRGRPIAQEMRLDKALVWIDQARRYQDGFIQSCA
jgi:hypothetical protein